MMIKAVCALIGLPVLALAALFIWGGLRSGSAPLSESDALIPAGILSEQLSDGMIEAQVYVLDNLAYRLEIQFSPNSNSNIPSTMPPEVNLSMESMHMDGFNQSLELVGNGAWQSQGVVPMAGRLSDGQGREPYSYQQSERGWTIIACNRPSVGLSNAPD